MTLTAGSLFALTAAYLGLLFVVARAGDRKAPATRLSRHPLVAALAVCVYATSWSYFGLLGVAAHDGWWYLAGSIGTTVSCALIPIVWAPLYRLVRERGLTSLADLFAYRYRSRAMGACIAAFLLISSLPYQALQYRALVASVGDLSGGGAPPWLGLMISVVLIAFGVAFGARHATQRDRHDGLLLAFALESLIKLIALLALAVWAIFAVFGGLSGLDAWLDERPDQLAAMAEPGREGAWVAIIVMSVVGTTFLRPQQWHLTFTETAGPRAFAATGWVLPMYMFLLTLAIPPMLWAARALGLAGDPDFFVLGLTQRSGSAALASLVFVGALSAATAMILVTTVALATMLQNHLVPPARAWARRGDLHHRLLWVRRALIAVIILGGYGVYLGLRQDISLVDLGLVSSVAVVQLGPGVLGVLFWPRATAAGALAGLAVGAALWAVTRFLPLFGIDLGLVRAIDGDPLTVSLTLSLGANALVFVWVSLAHPQRAIEAEAAATCARRVIPLGGVVSVTSPDEFAGRLACHLGAPAAERELERALADEGIARAERRPVELRRLRDRIESNLTGLLGPLPARAAVDDVLALDHSGELVPAQLRFVAEQREAAARDLDAASRYLRRVFDELPIGVITLGPAGDVVVWNRAIAAITGIDAEAAAGATASALSPPWSTVLVEFVDSGEAHHEIELPGARPRTIVLSRSELGASALLGASSGGVILLVEDRTEQRALEKRVMHKNRLETVGQVAAGVAHEVGSPLTAIRFAAADLRGDAADPDAGDPLGTIFGAIARIDRSVRALMKYVHAGEDAVARRPVALAEVVEEACTLARLWKAGRRVDVIADVPADLRVDGNAPLLEQVVVNLVANACDASPPGAIVTVVARPRGDLVELSVIDRGAGMSRDVQTRALEPFFTTKPPGSGTGLGLPLVYSIVVDHGGSIEIDSEPEVGTTVRVSLPLLGQELLP